MESYEQEVKDLIEITFPEKDDFLKIRETLTRIGVASRKEQELYQSCHILHKRGKYYITHFKELFILDGKPSNLDENDIGRRNTIINLLQQWNLLKVNNPDSIKEPTAPLSQIKIIPNPSPSVIEKRNSISLKMFHVVWAKPEEFLESIINRSKNVPTWARLSFREQWVQNIPPFNTSGGAQGAPPSDGSDMLTASTLPPDPQES